MIEILSRESIYLWYYISILFEQIFRYWIGGIIIGSTISVFGKKKIIEKFSKLQEKNIGILSIIPASILGILSPICMYGTIPIAASFSEKGMKDDWLAAFMMSSILLNPQLIIYSAALGVPALIIRICSAFISGIIAGIVVYIFYSSKDKHFFNFTNLFSTCNRDTDKNIFLRFLKNIARNIKATGPYFLGGIVLTALFQRYVPQDFINIVFNKNIAFGALMAAALGVPLYACGGGTIPLLFDWMAKGMSLSSVAAFMIAGPATKITNLGALKIVLGTKRFVIYFIFSILLAWSIGILVGLIF
ncbi:MAG: permease [Pleomorphochaeta sp.]